MNEVPICDYESLFREIGQYVRDKNYSEIDRMLVNCSPKSEYDCNMALGLIRYTNMLKNDLPGWNSALQRTKRIAQSILGEEITNKRFRGLNEEAFDKTYASEFVRHHLFGG